MRKKFEDFGEIKTFFDLIANRGMIFVTFVSIHSKLKLAFFTNRSISMTCEQRKEPVIVCRALKWQADR